MTADGYRPAQSRSGGAASALAISAAIVVGLASWSPNILRRVRPGETHVTFIPLPPEPQPDPLPRPQPRTQTARPVPIPQPEPQTVDLTPPIPLGPTAADPIGGTAGSDGGEGPVTLPTPTPIPSPVLVPAQQIGGDLQPPYPDEEANAGRGGDATVRLHIDVTGRVTAVEQVSATSAAFFRATRQWALAHWRFRPATRDGIPVDAWLTRRVHFVLND